MAKSRHGLPGRRVTRRDFLIQASRAPAAWPLVAPALSPLSLAAFGPRATPGRQPSRAPLVTFDEPGFPVVGAPAPPEISGAVRAATVASLAKALGPEAVLVWRHGAAFPADAWPSILRFLEAGGSVLHLGSEPFTRPVTGALGMRRVEPRTVAYLAALRLNQSYAIDLEDATLHGVGTSGLATRALGAGTRAFALEPRFTDAVDFPAEAGSPGAREAIVHPLAHVVRSGRERDAPPAAAAYAIDRLGGRFAGGRWVLWLLSSGPTSDELERLLAVASQPPIDVRLDPSFGCFHGGEQPSTVVRLHRPRARETTRLEGTVSLQDRPPIPIALDVAETGTMRVDLPADLPPGLHRVTLDLASIGRTETGFWIFDPDLFASGDRLSFDSYTLRRNDRPDPVVGTTVMSATVHRNFLFEPNAAVWDDTFAGVASADMNVVRTGFWAGWRRIADERGAVDEGVVRALEAFYLTARAHGLPVIFNLFAFTPEVFGGADPYFDPTALAGQRALVASLARRMAPARELVWDLINEPSFASPEKLWSLRPSGSAHERRAFLAWLEAREPGGGWEDAVRRRWRLRADEPIDLPKDTDFQDTYLPGERHPYRALDYALFAQDAFERWIGEMTRAIRDAGSDAPITVGQDEAGLATSPGPLFHHRALDFTSIHTWWANDALLWDGLMAKPSGAPLLVSETGIMQRARSSGEAVRDPGGFADLLSRKIGYAFAAGAFGVVEWIYDVNPYIASDNEAAIGLRRVDGSFKPELDVLADVARFVRRNRDRFDGLEEPAVALLVPTADQLSPRNTAQAATRAAVRALYETVGIRVRAVPDHRAARDLGRPHAIVLPACRGVSTEGWTALIAAVEDGATLVASGWFETDDAGLPADRLGATRRPLNQIEETTGPDGEPAVFRFAGTLPESWYAAVGAPRRIARGRGAIVHHPLPIEWADPTPSLAAHYRAAIEAAGVRPPVAVEPDGPGVTLVTLPFRRDWLLVAVNESGAPRRLRLSRPGRPETLTIGVPPARASLTFVDPLTWTVVDSQEHRP